MSDEFPEQFKQMGPEQVRLLMQTGGIAPTFYRAGVAWLKEEAEKEVAAEREREARNDKIMNEQLQLTKGATIAAWAAAAAAIVAAILAAVPLFR